jgi:hypothetical protein
MKSHAFLFGSGLSIPANLPSLAAITEQILTGKDVSRHTTGTYELTPGKSNPGDTTTDYVPAVLKLVTTIERKVSEFHGQTINPPNYEEIFYLCSQIRDSEYGEYENPVITPFIEKLLPELRPYIGESPGYPRRFTIAELSSEACKYIEHIVWEMLEVPTPNIDYLKFIGDSANDSENNIFDIFTLNHDTLVEQYLEKEKIEVTDGFGVEQNKIRYLDLKKLDENPRNIRIVKLHGSINWFRFISRSAKNNRDAIGIPLTNDLWHTKDPEGEEQLPADGSPMILVGGFNKILQYTSGIYADLHCQLNASLKNTQRLVVCGYSWGDKGINSRVINWVTKGQENKIIQIHPRPQSCKSKARGAIARTWDSWQANDQLRIISKGAEDIKWNEIKEAINIE